ncbi:unnamed protein product [Arabidopsis lyrata]|nr:unnamed protein product [Arabidopsis lyrata]
MFTPIATVPPSLPPPSLHPPPSATTRTGYLDDHGRFHKGCSPTPVITPTRKYKFLLPKMPTTPKLMDLFPAASSENVFTLPLIWQLEQRRAEDSAVTENGGANSSSIDLSLRL